MPLMPMPPIPTKWMRWIFANIGQLLRRGFTRINGDDSCDSGLLREQMQVEQRETISRQQLWRRRDVRARGQPQPAFRARTSPRDLWRESFGLLRERTRWGGAGVREILRCARLP